MFDQCPLYGEDSILETAEQLVKLIKKWERLDNNSPKRWQLLADIDTAELELVRKILR